MQTDMHYYGTYAMARAGGIAKEASRIIARASQFVDDNAKAESIEFSDGGRLDTVATAHHTADLANIDKADQRQIWVPFHFIPGNEGNHYTQRLMCTKDSAIAREMVEHHLSKSSAAYSLELLGICAHVYGDTFSHYGFSGVSSRRNRIAANSLIMEEVESELLKFLKGKEQSFFDKYGGERFLANIQSGVATAVSGALGHGSVLTYPDQPYLKWGFSYDWPKKVPVKRNNPQTFLEGCQALHAMFTRYAASRPDHAEGAPKQWDDIKDDVKAILLTQGDEALRIKIWTEAVNRGDLCDGSGEDLPVYKIAELKEELEGLKKWTDSSMVVNKPVFKFFQAAAYHRNYVLRDLLPAHQLLVA